jgi:hypothetical protein
MLLKRITYKRGKFSTIELPEKTRFYLEAIPDAVIVKKMKFKLFPSKQIDWEYKFPFYIRTLLGAWESSIEIVELIISCLEESDPPNGESFLVELHDNITPLLDIWSQENANRARMIGMDNLGKHYREP